MQLSRDEFLRISAMRGGRSATHEGSYGNYAVAPARPYDDIVVPGPEAQKIADSVEEMPEMREEIVASLRARIEAGTYHVSGEAIAEMMLRRMMADRAY